jgi:arabinan endo-1,5-alpha-L-arabinosidase
MLLLYFFFLAGRVIEATGIYRKKPVLRSSLHNRLCKAVLMKKMLLLGLLLQSLGSQAQAPSPAIPIHDPVLTRQNGTYYLFGTGNGVTVWSSKDRKNWTAEKPVFAAPPAWAVRDVPGFKGHVWAPDISFADGQYSLFYSISTFGKNRSAIGLATNKTLDPKSPDFKWTDRGAVIESVPGRDMWNAIDPNLVRDERGTPWLTFGSCSYALTLPAQPSPRSGARWPAARAQPRSPTRYPAMAPSRDRSSLSTPTITTCLCRLTTAAAGRRAPTR